MGNDVVFPFRILSPERLDPGGVEIRRRHFAFDGSRTSPARRNHEVDFGPPLVAPIPDVPNLQAPVQFVQDDVFPQGPHVLPPQVMPVSMVADESGVEPVHLRSRNDLRGSMRAERAQNVNDESRFEDGQVVRNGPRADLAGPGEPGRLENPSALRHQQLEEFLERLAPLQAEQFLDVLRPVGVHPLLVFALRQAPGQEKRGESAAQNPATHAGRPEIVQIGEDQRGQPDFGLPAGQGIPEFLRCTERRGSGGYDGDVGIVIGGDLEKLRGISESMDFIKDDPAALQAPEELLRILHQAPDARQLAIEVLDVGQRPAQHGLPRPANAGNPYDRTPFPFRFDSSDPEMPRLYGAHGLPRCYDIASYCYIVALTDTSSLPGFLSASCSGPFPDSFPGPGLIGEPRWDRH